MKTVANRLKVWAAFTRGSSRALAQSTLPLDGASSDRREALKTLESVADQMDEAAAMEPSVDRADRVEFHAFCDWFCAAYGPATGFFTNSEQTRVHAERIWRAAGRLPAEATNA